MKKRLILCVLIVLSLMWPIRIFAATFNNIVVFGDSLSDSGNLFRLIGESSCDPNCYYEGHFSNGLVWVEYLKGRLNLDDDYLLADYLTDPNLPLPDENLLYNFAVAGATAGGCETSPTDPLPLLAQVGAFLHDPNLMNPCPGILNGVPLPQKLSLPQNTLYIVWVGGNDFKCGVDPGQIGAFISRAITNIQITLSMLKAANVQDILVLNLPDLGLIPLNNSDPNTYISARALSEAFNAALKAQLDIFEAGYSGNLYRLDVFSLFGEIVTNPGNYGFNNVTESCPKLCTGDFTNDPNALYLFWDDIHPTTEAHKIIADKVYEILSLSEGEEEDKDGGCFIDTVAYGSSKESCK